MTKRAMIMAGGTGGHVFPALALAQELTARGWSIHWLGGNTGIENRAVPAAGYPLTILGTQGLRGKGLSAKIRGVIALLKAIAHAVRILRQQRPNVVVSLGGYTAGPGGVAAKLLGIPVVLHEQNAIAGLTNRLLARLAVSQAQAFPNTLPRAVTTGNPVRQDILDLPAPAERGVGQRAPLRVLVFGGSQGAQALNKTCPQALAAVEQPLDIRHQAGRDQASDTQAAYAAAGVEADVVEFIDDMQAAYQWADLAICRSGALTVSELAAVGLPALLVPLPIAVDDHQTANGRWLERAGAADIIPQSTLSEQLPLKLNSWLSDPELLQAAAQRGHAIAHRDATERLADLVEKYAHVE